MEKKQTLSQAEASELHRRFEEHYCEPVLPLHRFSGAIELWMDRIQKNNSDPEIIQECEFLPGHNYFNYLNEIRIDVRKSNLLGCLRYAKQKLRNRMCPLHKGHWSSRAVFFEKCPHLCDGTGWLTEQGETEDTRG